MTERLQFVLQAARELPREELPRFLGDLEEARVTAQARLLAPAASAAHDELLDVEAAAERLRVSTDYLYRNSKSLPFVRHMGRKLLFSSNGIDAHIRSRTSK